ncbi:uncharacterized protein [Apostichopus japonicus]|uniref:uncharacterized protein n=1 Tax=Stichopus japonicus TaxID=307972 RepID=UPI003AB1CEED
MSDRDITIVEGCSCGNNDPSNFWILRNTQKNEIWGVCCKKRSCQKEYLVDRFANENEEQVMIVNEVLLYANKPIACQLDPDFQVRLSRERVNSLADVEPGDHVGFDRSYLIWHHAIVVKVNEDSLVIEGWDGLITTQRVSDIIEESELTHLHRFKYSDDIGKKNPPELVLARSRSRLHGDEEDAGLPRPWVLEEYGEHYGFFNANCEHYSTYCKTGQSSCNQISWLGTKLKEACYVSIGTSCKSLLADFTLEVIENFAQELTAAVGIHNSLFEMIGLLGVVLVESGSFCRAVRTLQRKRQCKEIDEEQYREELEKRVIEFLLVVVVAGGGGIIIAACYSPVVEILLSPILVIGAKMGARFITRFIPEKARKAYQETWELLEDTLLNIKKRLENIKNGIEIAAQKAANFVSTEVLPAICSAIEAIREFFAWLIC